jgi:hypothetical protein
LASTALTRHQCAPTFRSFVGVALVPSVFRLYSMLVEEKSDRLETCTSYRTAPVLAFQESRGFAATLLPLVGLARVGLANAASAPVATTPMGATIATTAAHNNDLNLSLTRAPLSVQPPTRVCRS